MPNQTNNELLQVILAQSKLNAKNQLDLAAKLSTFINSQGIVNFELKGYLESNFKTNQKGVVEQAKENSDEIKAVKAEVQEIRTEKKIEKAKQTLLGVVVGSILAFLGKMLF